MSRLPSQRPCRSGCVVTAPEMGAGVPTAACGHQRHFLAAGDRYGIVDSKSSAYRMVGEICNETPPAPGAEAAGCGHPQSAHYDVQGCSECDCPLSDRGGCAVGAEAVAVDDDWFVDEEGFVHERDRGAEAVEAPATTPATKENEMNPAAYECSGCGGVDKRSEDHGPRQAECHTAVSIPLYMIEAEHSAYRCSFEDESEIVSLAEFDAEGGAAAMRPGATATPLFARVHP